MSFNFQFAPNTVYTGDCCDVMRCFPSECVDLVITSPPYFQQRNYGGGGIGNEESCAEYVQAVCRSFAEVVRITKPTGSIVYNVGDKITRTRGALLAPYRFALAVLDAHPQLTLLNHITWAKKNPQPRQFKRRLVSSTEPFFHFVKSSQYFYDVDNFFRSPPPAKKPTPTANLGRRIKKTIENSSLSKKEKSCALTALEEVVEEVRSGKIAGFRIKVRGTHSLAFGGQRGGRNTQIMDKGFSVIRMSGASLKKDYIETAVESSPGIHHPAIFPIFIIEEFIKMACCPGGVVLDPYCGSGTSLLAAKKLLRDYVGVDINKEYTALSRRRLGEMDKR